MAKVLIVDGNSVLNRAYFAMPEWRNRAGEATAGVYGFLSMLLKTVEDIEPSHLIVVFDSREGVNFRKQLYVGYQANRRRDEKIEADIWSQVEKLKDVFARVGVPVYQVGGVEADDTIGTLCRLVTERESEAVVVTADRDLMQLVDDKVKLLMPNRGLADTSLVDAGEVKRRLGVWPGQVVDYKALVGDSSDNYPGVVGIGPSTAVKLLGIFGTYERIYLGIEGKNKEEGLGLGLSKSQREKLMAGKPGGDLSLVLATVKKDVPLDFDFQRTLMPAKEKWTEVLMELGYKSLAARSSRGAAGYSGKNGQEGLF